MSKADLMWVVGLLEGEGCFTAARSTRRVRVDGTRGPDIREPRVQLAMCDKDVLDRFARLVGFGKVYGPYVNHKAEYRTICQWYVGGHRAEMLMSWVFDEMGERRQARILEVLEICNEAKKWAA